MRRLLSVLLVGILIVTMTGCGETTTPSETTVIFLDSLKSIDTETSDSVYDPSSSHEFIPDSDSPGVETAIETVKKGELFKLFQFDYEILDEKKEGNHATVDIKVVTYDLESAFASFMDTYIPYALTSEYAAMTQNEKLTTLIDFANKEASKVTKKNFENTATVELIKIDHQWKITNVDENPDLIYAISGGLSDLVTEFSNIL